MDRHFFLTKFYKILEQNTELVAFKYFGKKIFFSFTVSRTQYPEPVFLVKPNYTPYLDDIHDGRSVEFYGVCLHSAKREKKLLKMIT